MTTMNKRQDPYKVQLADVANEIGGNMTIKYYTLDCTLTKEQLQDMKKNGLKTDVMSCIFAALVMNGMNETEVKEYIEKAHNAGAAPSVTFEAPDDGALNVTSSEENPELDKLVKAMGIQNAYSDEEAYINDCGCHDGYHDIDIVQ